MSDPTEFDYLFTWLHLSDLHFGHPKIRHDLEQALVIGRLLEDLEHLRDRPDIPNAGHLLVTGDVAFGGMRHEFVRAGVFLDSARKLFGIEPRASYFVPGNHDVERGSSQADKGLYRLLDGIRETRV